jgi:hypothetical protein
MVTTLTGGGTADALHSHAAQAAPGTPTTMSAESTATMNFGDAVRHCRDLTEGGFTDWSLPSMAEIWTVYEMAVVGNDLSSTQVWTSSNAEDAYAHKRTVRFSDGYQWYTHSQNSTNAVRCVR